MDAIKDKDEELTLPRFQKTFFGYETGAVDKYLNAVTESYAALYRTNAELEYKLGKANERLSDLSGEEEKIKKKLELADAAAEKIVKDAYERADGILVSIRKSCDTILRGFRDKVEMNRASLSEMREAVSEFKAELFNNYRAHIELIERLLPADDFQTPDMDVTPEQYVENVVSELKDNTKAEYDISLESLTPPKSVSDKEHEEYSDMLSSASVFSIKPGKKQAEKNEPATPVQKPEEKAVNTDSVKEEARAVVPEKEDDVRIFVPGKAEEEAAPKKTRRKAETGTGRRTKKPLPPSDIQLAFDFDSPDGEVLTVPKNNAE